MQPTRKKWPTIALKVLFFGTSGVSQAALLVDVVKRTLRHKGLTYRYVAKGLKLSLVMAIRPWELAMFGELRRSKGQKDAGPIRTERRKSNRE